MKVVIIGGGAAGFFAAIRAKTIHPTSDVVILEQSKKLLSKVKVSGGGRCNVTNAESSLVDFANAYPRGRTFMKKALRAFSNQDTIRWFADRGVSLKTEPDGRMFPTTDDSQTIIDCLMGEIDRLGIKIQLGTKVIALDPKEDQVILTTKQDKMSCSHCIIASGGSPKISGMRWLSDIGVSIESPVPSLFTFNMPTSDITNLMGVVAPHTMITIQGMKHQSQGPLLITHWGMSGPAILRMSAMAARELADCQYNFQAQINWPGIKDQEEVKRQMLSLIETSPKKKVYNTPMHHLPSRLWHYLLKKSDIHNDHIWIELPKKLKNKLISTLSNDVYTISGKTTFKEEFVTCGGVALSSINHQTMSSKLHPRLYFSGEVLDIDGITGGYNFQAAWTTGYIAGQLQ